MKIAFQMDPIEPIDIAADSTFRLAEEAQARGHELFYYTPDHLAYQEGRVTATGWPLSVQRVVGNHAILGLKTEVDLADFDVIWLRQDPPFDMHYITTTHLLDRALELGVPDESLNLPRICFVRDPCTRPRHDSVEYKTFVIVIPCLAQVALQQ